MSHLRLLFIAGLALLAVGRSQSVPASYPQWWVDYGIIDPAGDHSDNQSIVNQGQAKHFTAQAIAYLNDKLASQGGAGFTLEDMLSTQAADHYAPLNIGQLKNLTSRFYDRFAEVGFTPSSPGWPATLVLDAGAGDNAPTYPWMDNVTPENLKPAKLGQIKHLFSWVLPDVESTGPKLASLIIDDVTGTWQTITLPYTYTETVAVATPVNDYAQTPAVVRIRNAAGNTLEIKLQNPGDGSATGSRKVHLLTAEAGSYTQAEHGATFEAVRVLSTTTDRKNSWNAQAYSPLQSYTTPVVLGQVMTANDPNWSSFWSRGTSARNPASSGNIYLGKHVGEDSNTTRQDETLGVFIFESGALTIDGETYLTGVGPDSVRGGVYTYALSGLTQAESVILSSSGMDGGDGGWPILIPPTELTSTQIRLGIDEDQIGDSERGHTTEQVAYFVSGSITTMPSQDTDGDGMPDDWELAYGLDPNDPNDATLDFDGDGLTNLEEFLAGSDPGDPVDADLDYDSDGLTNFEESQTNTDPLEPDTDLDGSWDGSEVSALTDPLIPDNPIVGLIIY